MEFKGRKYFSREDLESTSIAEGEDGTWLIKTVRIDRDSLQPSIIKTFFKADTMGRLVETYLASRIATLEFRDPLDR